MANQVKTAASIRVRCDGRLEGINGPVNCLSVTRAAIAGIMGWGDAGDAAPVITNTLALLSGGRTVKLTSRLGVCYLQPLLDSEDGRMIPASRSIVHDADGSVIERVI